MNQLKQITRNIITNKKKLLKQSNYEKKNSKKLEKP